MSCVLLWFRNDLRILDHEPLVRAIASGLPVLALYCFDPRQYAKTSFGFEKTAVHRARFILESVQDLRDNLGKLGGRLILRRGKPEDVIAALVKTTEIRAIYYHKEIASEELEVEKAIQKACPDIPHKTSFGHNLIHPSDLPFEIRQLPDVFTGFRKMVERQLTIRPEWPVPASMRSLDIVDAGEMPTPADLGFGQQQGAGVWRGGETKGQERLAHYFYGANRLKVYKETRNGMLNPDDSSKLSPYLAQGCLSPRTVYWKIKAYEKARGANASTYWLFFELLWRDYFWLVHWKFQNRMFHPGGLFHLPMEWSLDEGYIAAWLEGETGYPLVDANMKELKSTGFMSNRGRQNVASFLTKNLGIDWRLGAQWFESLLIDYDVASNYGNWCYGAGVGNDARIFRTFHVTKQGKDYDHKGEYAKQWLPALAHIPGNLIYEVPNFTWIEQQGYGLVLGKHYPAPIVDLLRSSRLQKEKFEKAWKGR